MPDLVKQVSVKRGLTEEVRDIGAEAQNIDVSYDANNEVITDITDPTAVIDHTNSVAVDLNNRAIKKHNSRTDIYGSASKTEYGHVKVGNNINVVNGVISVSELGGSNITIVAKEPTLYGKDVVITAQKGSDPITTTLDINTGIAQLKGYKGTGLVTFISTDGDLIARTDDNIPYFGNYTEELAFWNAPVQISTTTEQMFGKPIIVKKNGIEVGSSNFDMTGHGLYVAHGEGNYTFECTLGWRTFNRELVITNQETYNIEITGYVSTVNITTPSVEFYSQPITVKSVDDSSIPTTVVNFDEVGTAVYYAYKPANYSFSVTIDE